MQEGGGGEQLPRSGEYTVPFHHQRMQEAPATPYECSVRCNLGAAWPFSVHCWWLRPLTLPASIGTLAPSTNRLRHLSRISHLSPFPSRRHHCPRHCDNGRLDLPRRQLTVCQLLHIDSGCPPAGDGWVGGAYQRYFAEMYPVPGYIHDVMKQGF